MSDFAQRSLNYTDARLFEILREADKYDPEAVIAAQAEIERRGLGEADIPATPNHNPLNRLGDLVDGVAFPQSTRQRDDVIDWIDEPNQESSAGQRYLQLLLIASILSPLIDIYNQWDYIRFVFGPLAQGYESILLILVGVLFQAFIIFMLWRRKRIGYQLTAGFAAYTLIGFLGLLLYLVQTTEIGTYAAMAFFVKSRGLEMLSGIGLSAAIIWLASREELMALFKVSRAHLSWALAIGTGLALILGFFSYMTLQF